MNIESLWEQTCALLSRDMPYVSYNTWVEGNMVPVILEDDTMFITVKMDRMISMIQSKYADLIEKRLSEAAGRPMKIVLLGKDEMAARLSSDENDDSRDDNDPHIPLKASWWAMPTALRRLRRWLSPRARAKPITRCLSMAVWALERLT